jgi:D-glycero-D-manno-heptose 1,7-bisphosphate phosphatase
VENKITLVIFDVDGTLVTTASGATFRKTADDWQYIPGRMEKVQQLRREGVKIGIASNQAGVAFPWSSFSEAGIQFEIERVAHDIWADYVGICYSTPNPKALPQYHNPDDTRRKPGPGMIIEAMQWYSIRPEYTLFVGDRDEDEKAAVAAGVTFQHADDFFADGEK